MEDRTIIAAILLIAVSLIQITSFLLGHNGQVVLVTSNVIVGLLAYYFGAGKNK